MNITNIKYILLSLLAIILTIIIGITLSSNINKSQLLDKKPNQIIIANISTKTAQIYWKTNIHAVTKIYLKQENSSAPFAEISDLKTFNDNLSGNKLYLASLENLEPNTKYIYRIETGGYKWPQQSLENTTFQTLDYAKEITIPNIITGESLEQTFVLVKTGNANYMLDTQYHGTWAMDLSNPDYKVRDYANYRFKNDLKQSLISLVSPVSAASGSNCSVGIKINSSAKPSKTQVASFLDKWVQGCSKGHYGNECYADVYCRSLAAGVDPGFSLTMWAHESGGSNYAYRSNVQDFGIVSSTVAKADFNAQITRFLQIQSNFAGYVKQYNCNSQNTLSQNWAIIYFVGPSKCTQLFASVPALNGQTPQDFLTEIEWTYQALTGTNISWSKINIPKQTTACSKPTKTNDTYNSCTQTGLPGDQDPIIDPEKPDPPSKDKDDMIVNGKDRYCVAPNGCRCLYWYNTSKEKIVEVSNGYTCPAVYTGKGFKTEKICCETTTGLSVKWPYDCKGTILKDTPIAQCKSTEKTIPIEKGINFIQAPDITGSTEEINTAKALITYSKNKVLSVGLFRNDKWEKVIKNEGGKISGSDFTLTPGESYLVVASEPFTIKGLVFPAAEQIELNKLTGWNLIPSSLFTSNSLSTNSILQDTKYAYIKQIAVWKNSNSNFEYTIEDVSGKIYGEKINIPNDIGFFVKITK